MARCPHKRVQPYTECCLDCGRNVYETDEEYYKYLKNRTLSDEIEKLEKQLGIKHPGNTNNGKPDCDDKCGTCYCSCGGYCQTW